MKLLFRWLPVLAFWLGAALAAHASHVLGGEITYSPVASTTAGVPRYHIKVRIYRDPAGVAVAPLTLYCSRNGCAGTGPGSFSRLLPITTNQGLSFFSVGCPTGPVYRYEIYTFDTEEDLPRGQWTFSVAEDNRSAGIRNIIASQSSGFYVSASLNNSLVDQNSSPKFLSTLLPYLCGNQAQRYSFSAFDIEGDSLVYSFVYPQQRASQTVPQCGTVLAGSLLSPHFQLNPATGALTTQAGAVQQGLYNMVGHIDEYRRVGGSWQVIGNVTRDVSYLAYSSSNQSPRFTSLTLGNSPQPVEQFIRVQPGQTVSLLLGATDPDAGQTIRFASQAPDVVPGLSLSTVGATQARLTWQVPGNLPLGRYTATIAVLDNGCPLNASEEQTLSFLVTNQVLATQAAAAPEAAAFPMPFREQVQFQAGAGGQAVTVVDALGRVVAHLSSAADGRVLWTPAAALPAGLYMARGADGRLLARLLRAAN